HDQKIHQVQDRAEKLAKERLVGYVVQHLNGKSAPRQRAVARRRGGRAERAAAPVPAEESARPAAEMADARAFEPAQVATMLETAQLDDAMIEIELTNLGYGYDPFDDSP